MSASPGVAREDASARWVPAYVALGSNLDDPARQVRRALEALGTLPDTLVVARSSLYRTAPMGPVPQPDFVNAVAGLLTRLDARSLLRRLKSLETQLGRAVPVQRWGPRLIDLDLLVHGTERVAEEGITVPHPGVAERAFVLVPLAEISAGLVVPGMGRVSALVQKMDTTGMERLDR